MYAFWPLLCFVVIKFLSTAGRWSTARLSREQPEDPLQEARSYHISIVFGGDSKSGDNHIVGESGNWGKTRAKLRALMDSFIHQITRQRRIVFIHRIKTDKINAMNSFSSINIWFANWYRVITLVVCFAFLPQNLSATFALNITSVRYFSLNKYELMRKLKLTDDNNRRNRLREYEIILFKKLENITK